MSLQSRVVSGFYRRLKAICYLLGIENLLYSKLQSKDVIILFHSVLDVERANVNIRNLSAVKFEKLVKYLKSNFKIVSLSEMLNSPSDVPRIAITFDDGLINNLRFALPILEKHRAPATIFITTCRLNGEGILWPDRWNLLSLRIRNEIVFSNVKYTKTAHNAFRNPQTGEKITDVFLRTDSAKREEFFTQVAKQLNYNPYEDQELENLVRIMKGEEIKILADSPMITIGSHCVTHENLLLLSPEEIENELIESKRYLEQVQNKSVESIAYPFGLYNRNIMDAAEKSGYKSQLAVDYIHTEDILDSRIHNRLGLYNDLTVFEQLDSIQRAFR